MDRTAFAMSLGFGILVLTAQQAFPQARTTCAPRAVALEQLARKWGETRRAVMLGPNRVFEVFAADESGSWTLLGTDAEGVSCILASGIAYEPVAAPGGDPA